MIKKYNVTYGYTTQITIDISTTFKSQDFKKQTKVQASISSSKLVKYIFTNNENKSSHNF